MYTDEVLICCRSHCDLNIGLYKRC